MIVQAVSTATVFPVLLAVLLAVWLALLMLLAFPLALLPALVWLSWFFWIPLLWIHSQGVNIRVPFGGALPFQGLMKLFRVISQTVPQLSTTYLEDLYLLLYGLPKEFAQKMPSRKCQDDSLGRSGVLVENLISLWGLRQYSGNSPVFFVIPLKFQQLSGNYPANLL